MIKHFPYSLAKESLEKGIVKITVKLSADNGSVYKESDITIDEDFYKPSDETRIKIDNWIKETYHYEADKRGISHADHITYNFSKGTAQHSFWDEIYQEHENPELPIIYSHE